VPQQCREIIFGEHKETEDSSPAFAFR